MKRVAALAVVVALAGCGGTAQRAKPPAQPRLPRDLAQSWARQSDAVAAQLAAGNGCAGLGLATSLHAQFVAAVDSGRVPARLQETLGSAFADLQSRISCTPRPSHRRKGGHGDQQGNNEGGD